MTTHWHFYCDEAGAFEEIRSKKSLITGILVAKEDKKVFADRYRNLKNECGFRDCVLHSRDHFRKTEFARLCSRLVDLIIEFGIRTIRMRYEHDIINEYRDPFSEAHRCNRYLYMIQELMEHFLFFDPRSYGKNITYSFHPNSRVFASRRESLQEVQSYGFKAFETKGAGKILVEVWDKVGLRIFLNRLLLDYRPHLKKTGRREIAEVEMPQANRSSDPFVELVDILAFILMWQEDKPWYRKLESSLDMDLSYGKLENTYRELCRLYLRNRHKEFIHAYSNALRFFSTGYYRKQLRAVARQAINFYSTLNAGDIHELERLAASSLRKSTGEWAFFSPLVDNLISSVTALPDDVKKTPEMKRTLYRLYGHKFSFHNHRGECVPAFRVIENVRKMEFEPETIEEWREQIDFLNRQAVMGANLFDFHHGTEVLTPVLECLERSNGLINEFRRTPLKDSLVGQIRGTLAQNLAFLAPFKSGGEPFEKAEALFLRARSEFHSPDDILRQNTYLLHLYLDWKRKDKQREVLGEILADEDIRKFLTDPGPDSAKYKQFFLALYLKHACQHSDNSNEFFHHLLESHLKMKNWFGEAAKEHPFEFIYSYLARMACVEGDYRKGSCLFMAALDIPHLGEKEIQVTLQTIRAQILVHWAIHAEEAGETGDAIQKITEAHRIMNRIGKDEDLKPVLVLDGNRPIGGWFAEAYPPLDEMVRTARILPENCRGFLRYFTFNYR